MKQNVVARFQDGSMLKGVTTDFFPNKDEFHLVLEGSEERRSIRMNNLKAVFFVHTFDGKPEYQENVDIERGGLGRKIRVDFSDGETLLGYTSGYAPNRKAFFVFPVDPDSNNDRAYVITSATKAVEFV